MSFLAEAPARYLAANAGTLRWMLDRPRLHGTFLNTKLNPVTLVDYGPQDGWRGPDWVYGWIQGRGLESLITHAGAYPGPFADDLNRSARVLYNALNALSLRDGAGFFRYGPDMQPVCGPDDGPLAPQVKDSGVRTFSDAFFAKGLVCGAARFTPADLPRQLAFLHDVIAAIEDDRFQMAEKVPLSRSTATAEPKDFGPRMILLSASGMLRDLGIATDMAWADRFVDHILTRHFDPASGLLRNAPGGDDCSTGHGIEFAGFAMEHLGPNADPATVKTLERILVSSFDKGFQGPGVRLMLSVATGQPTSPFCPWWALPETIRSAALIHAANNSAEALRLWQTADAAFWGGYWRTTPPIAYQCRTDAGPVDYVPATPCLDPGYHTGLCLLTAARIAQGMEG